jgi:hypothetical protein
MNDSVIGLTLVSAILIWEILHFLGLNSWNNHHFNLEIGIRLIESSKDFVMRFILIIHKNSSSNFSIL